MASISIKLPANLAEALASTPWQHEQRLVPWLAAWILADHRIGNTPLPDETRSTPDVLVLARERLARDRHGNRMVWTGETGLAEFVEGSEETPRRRRRTTRSAPSGPAPVIMPPRPVRHQRHPVKKLTFRCALPVKT